MLWNGCHKTLRTVTTHSWPARSPDLSPIQHIWDHLGQRVGHPTSLNELANMERNVSRHHIELSLVYADKPQTLDHLEDNICRVIADIRPQMLEKSSKIGRPDGTTSGASRGSPMPEIIFKM
ncbi:hypothetical protein TNCV_1306441 [Trichonephila clavipes]|nr:hypothetical protein TNCV_1306441 [Trichonephila clavipes]